MLLDEATAALDPASEMEVAEAVRELAVDRTVICVSHRLAIIPDDGAVCVMRKGRVARQGIFADLLAEDRGPLATLWTREKRAHRAVG